jgi:hypothetical protein
MCNVLTIERYASYNSVIAVADRVLVLVGWSRAGVLAIVLLLKAKGMQPDGQGFVAVPDWRA